MTTDLKRNIAPAVAEDDLRVLRKLLLAPEQEVLRKLKERLDDPETRAREMAAVLPAALLLASEDAALRQALAESLKELVRETLAEILRQRPESAEIGDAVKEPAHRLQTARHWLEAVGRKLRRHSESEPPQLEQLYLVRRVDGVLLEQSVRPLRAEQETPQSHAEQSRLLSLVMSFMECVRDPAMLDQYAAQRSLRVEGFVLGFHVSDRFLLLSVIRAADDVPFEELLGRCDAILAQLPKTGKIKTGARLLPEIAENAGDQTPLAHGKNKEGPESSGPSDLLPFC